MMFDVLDAENIPVSNGVVNVFCRQLEIAMAASKPEVVIIQVRNEIAAKFKRLPLHFRTGLKLVPTLSDVGRQPEIIMAASKPEVVLSPERNEISAKFQWLRRHFRTCPTQWNWFI